MSKPPKTTTAPTGQVPPFGLRMLPDLRDQIESAARNSGRSMNAEIVARLQQTFEGGAGVPEAFASAYASMEQRLSDAELDAAGNAGRMAAACAALLDAIDAAPSVLTAGFILHGRDIVEPLSVAEWQGFAQLWIDVHLENQGRQVVRVRKRVSPPVATARQLDMLGHDPLPIEAAAAAAEPESEPAPRTKKPLSLRKARKP